MKEGLNPGWRKEGRFTDMFSGYTIVAFKYTGPDGEVGWQTKSWPMKDPIHDFWVSGEKFYRVNVLIPEFCVTRHTIKVLEEIENVDPAERKAILEGIEAWERQIAETLEQVTKSLATNKPSTH